MEELQRPVEGSYFEHLRMLKQAGNRRMEDMLDMTATFDPNAPPLGPRPSLKSPRFGRRADRPGVGAGAGFGAASSVTAAEIADFVEFTGATRDDAEEALRGAKARGLYMVDAVRFYMERSSASSRDSTEGDIAGGAAGGAAAAPPALRLAFDSDEDDVVAVPRGGAALSGGHGGGAAIARHAASIVVDETQPDAMQFMDITGADRDTARRFLAGAKQRGENVEAAINYYFATGGGGGGGSDVDMGGSSDDSAEESGGILSTAANAAMNLLSRLGVGVGDAAQGAAPEPTAYVAAPAASAARARAAGVARVLPMPRWPATVPVEMRSYATQLLAHMTDHASDSQSKSNATYVTQLSSACRDWTGHFGGATSATKKRNVDGFVMLFSEALEARRPAAGPAPSAPPAPHAAGRERRSRVMGEAGAGGVAARATAESATRVPPPESGEVQLLMSVTQKSARACRVALRDAGGDINVAMDRLTRE